MQILFNLLSDTYHKDLKVIKVFPKENLKVIAKNNNICLLLL